MKTTTKRNEKWAFYKALVSVAIVNVDPTLTIVNDDPSLTFVNEEKRSEETHLKGIGTYYLEVLKKISRSFSSPTSFYLHVERHSIKLHIYQWKFFSKTIFF